MKKWQLILIVFLGFPVACFMVTVTGVLDRLEELEVRNNFSHAVNRIAGLKISKNVRSLQVRSMTALNGESFLEIVLELTDQQKQEAIAQVTNNPNWNFKFDSYCLTKTEKENFQNSVATGSNFPEVKNTYIYSKTNLDSHRSAILCPFKKSLLVQASD